jgi:serine/threonine protein phosphatase PrpC
MTIKASARSDVGQRRARNEDAFFCDEAAGLFVVCDGMGGHARGDVASRLACDVFSTSLLPSLDALRLLARGTREDRGSVLRSLQEAVQEANAAVWQQAQNNPEQRGMGTTFTALWVVDAFGFVVHVGDSRLYVVRNEALHQVTTDHTVYEDLARQGRATPESRRANPSLGALTRAVGVYPTVQLDALEIAVLPRDVFLLCSDGLHGYLEDLDVPRLVAHCDRALLSQELVELANRRGGLDNITVVAVHVLQARETAQTLRLRLTLRTLRALSLFQHLSYSELLQVVTVCEPIELPSGHVLMEQGEDADAMYIVLEGALAVARDGHRVALLGEGRHVGEMALVDQQPRSATVTAEGKATVIRIERGAFFELLRGDPVLAVKLLWNMLQALSAMVRAQPATLPLAEAALEPHPVGEPEEEP